jgi:hypothetical protein
MSEGPLDFVLRFDSERLERSLEASRKAVQDLARVFGVYLPKLLPDVYNVSIAGYRHARWSFTHQACEACGATQAEIVGGRPKWRACQMRPAR